MNTREATTDFLVANPVAEEIVNILNDIFPSPTDHFVVLTLAMAKVLNKDGFNLDRLIRYSKTVGTALLLAGLADDARNNKESIPHE